MTTTLDIPGSGWVQFSMGMERFEDYPDMLYGDYDTSCGRWKSTPPDFSRTFWPHDYRYGEGWNQDCCMEAHREFRFFSYRIELTTNTK